MGYGYEMICMDCGEILFLAKFLVRAKILSDNQVNEPRWIIAGINDKNKDYIEPSKEDIIVLEQFLIKHRNHELRIISDYLMDQIDPGAAYFPNTIYDFNDLEQLKIIDEPDPIEDASKIPQEVIERIRKGRPQVNED